MKRDSYEWRGQGSSGTTYTEAETAAPPARTHVWEVETGSTQSNLSSRKKKVNTAVVRAGIWNQLYVCFSFFFLPAHIQPTLRGAHALASSWSGRLSAWSRHTGRSVWGWWSGFGIRPASPEDSSWWSWPCSGLWGNEMNWVITKSLTSEWNIFQNIVPIPHLFLGQIDPSESSEACCYECYNYEALVH